MHNLRKNKNSFLLKKSINFIYTNGSCSPTYSTSILKKFVFLNIDTFSNKLWVSDPNTEFNEQKDRLTKFSHKFK